MCKSYDFFYLRYVDDVVLTACTSKTQTGRKAAQERGIHHFGNISADSKESLVLKKRILCYPILTPQRISI